MNCWEQSKKKRKSQNFFIWDIVSNWEDFHDFILLLLLINNVSRCHLSILDLRNVVTTALEEGYRKQEKGRKPWVALTSDNLRLKGLIPYLSFSSPGAPDAQDGVCHKASGDGSVHSRALEEVGQHPRIRSLSSMLRADNKMQWRNFPLLCP